MALGYRLNLGGNQYSWPAKEQTLNLVDIQCSVAFGGNTCTVEMAPPQGAAPQPGDAFSLQLDGGDGFEDVFSGEIDGVRATPLAWVISANDGLPRLARLDPEKAWKDTTADVVLKDLLGMAALSPGTVPKGPSLRVYYMFRGTRGLRQAELLLDRMGADLWVDAKGKVQVDQPKEGSAAHRFTWGETLLEVQLERSPPPLEGVEVWGEGAGASQGTTKAHWLPKDLGDLVGRFQIGSDGKAQSGAAGQPGIRMVDGALASAEACKQVAEAMVKRSAARPLLGYIRVPGTPALQPGQGVALQGLPNDHALAAVVDGKVLRVRQVLHQFSVAQGYTTRVDF